MKQRANVALRIPPELWARFMVLCDEHGENAHAVTADALGKLCRHMEDGNNPVRFRVAAESNVEPLRRQVDRVAGEG